MLGLVVAIVLFNLMAFKMNKSLSAKQIAHIWVFTIAFQINFDIFIDVKYQGYWYFSRAVDWAALPAHTVLIPPVNIIFLNWYPYHYPLWKQIRYILCWDIALLLYELLTLVPAPWGYFHYGWWNLSYSAAINPILLTILLLYYKKFIK